ncbi:DUF1398 domain-containing protein [Belliella kenyensis]|uniref:DUF1398 domain-containing protein n=1 Tax=Belliella kenyensis TaxID=1472724 RepID=UPI00338FD698
MGVSHYDNFVTDGSTLFFGRDNFVLEGNSKYPSLTLNEESSSTKLKQAITIHQQGQSDYPTFCKQAADSGVQKWTTHMINMTVTYFDKFGNIMVEEKIPQS